MGEQGRKAVIVVMAAAVAIAAVLTVVAVVADGPTSLDRSVSAWVAGHRPAWLVSTMQVVTHAGSFRATLVVGLVAAIWGWRRRDLRALAFVVVTAFFASWLTNVVKLAVARPRPGTDVAVRVFQGYAFPSGHATTAAALWGAVAVVAVASGRCSVRLAIAAWAVIVVVVSASRVVLGAHWLTDVTAGAAVGSACVAGAILLADRWGVAER